jgi:hypothetical protein
LPNWCSNLLEIGGTAENKKQLLEHIKPKEGWEGCKKESVLSLYSIVPIPKECPDWYGWCVRNWDTKWDVDAEFVRTDPDNLTDEDNIVIRFESAWGPPLAAIEALAKQFPNCPMCILYAEPGMDINGVEEYNMADIGDWQDFYATNRGNISNLVAGYIYSY